MRATVSQIHCAEVPGLVDWQRFLPARQSDTAAGFDLRACHIGVQTTASTGDSGFPATIEPGARMVFGAGFIVAIPPGFLGEVTPRSGLAIKHGITITNSPGLIDSDYRGEIGVCLENGGSEPLVVNRGDRIAQMVIVSHSFPELHRVDDPSKILTTVRGSGGFGHTGVAGDGLGTEGYDAALRKMDAYFMQIVLTTAGLSNCVRGCPLDENGRPAQDAHGQLIGQTRRLGCGDRFISGWEYGMFS